MKTLNREFWTDYLPKIGFKRHCGFSSNWTFNRPDSPFWNWYEKEEFVIGVEVIEFGPKFAEPIRLQLVYHPKSNPVIFSGFFKPEFFDLIEGCSDIPNLLLCLHIDGAQEFVSSVLKSV